MIRTALLTVICSIMIIAVGCKGPTGPAGPAGRDGILIDSLSIHNNYSVRLIGDNFSDVEVGYSPVYKLQRMTVEFWVWVDSLNSTFTPLISAIGIDQQRRADGFGLKFEAGRVYFTLATSSILGNVYGTLYVPPVKQWVHVAGTYDGQDARIFINGQQALQYADTQTVWNGGAGLAFGAGYNTGLGGAAFLRGRMDEIRIWDYARTAAQIQQTMNTKISGTESGLVGYWNFDDPRLSYLAIDESIYNNHGVIWGDAMLDPVTPFP